MRDESISQFLDTLAAKSPAPGGGAAAALLAAIGAALAEMVVRFSQGKKHLQEHEPLYHDLLQLLEVSRQAALAFAEEDARAYEHLNALQRLDPDDARRRAEWNSAVERSMSVPQRVLDLSLDLLNLCEQLIGRSNHWLRSDLAIAAIAADSAAAAAAWNIRANLPRLEREDVRARLRSELENRLSAARDVREKIERLCR